MDIDHLKRSLLHSKIAVFAIVAFLALLVWAIVITTNQLASNSVIYQPNAQEGTGGMGYGIRHSGIRLPGISKGDKKNEVKNMSVYYEECNKNGGSCIPKFDCDKAGGTSDGRTCTDGGITTLGVCCMPKTVEPTPVVEINYEDCARSGGSCMTGMDCSQQGGTEIGKCFDGISRIGVCCVLGKSDPTPTSIILSTQLDPSCASMGGACIAYCSITNQNKCEHVDGPSVCKRLNKAYLGTCFKDNFQPSWKYACCKKG